ncbi:D-aminoacyl-tRNA deacylase [Pontibacter sp. G13]|uniref:D-aminoacyl-tRNA deacylase n=1 Tax=Pontibacter sp. G13 TaxID=3074898 RepID=UPI00288AB25F|nr:D-aminoacyl-tRNA deacylase [Pontibacter sp. G13]WNJ16356.1 D-aminoacyl-tRNA deacylase [Pontibacter sp. G13]
MRVILQRVAHAQVVVEGNTIGKIDQGMLVLLGVTHEDQQADIDWLVKKLMQLRVFNDPDGKMNLSIQDVEGDFLVISQFTLFANSKKGNRPSYTRSAPPDISIPMYEQFVQTLRSQFAGKVETGQFGAEMKVSLLNDGPVTIILDSKHRDF